MPKSVEVLLGEARSRLKRVSPQQAYEGDALLVDIRPHAQRVREGEVPNAVVIERNVLEWRFDLQSEWHIDEVANYEQPVVVFCSEGYTSSLAAAALQELGFLNATDLNGGFVAWAAAGLPIQPGGTAAMP